jgi:hypothetical protein
MIGSFLCYGWFLSLFPRVWQQVGSTLTLAAYLYCLRQFGRRGAVNRVLAGTPATTCAAYKAELERLRDFSLVRRLMLAFIPGPAIFLLSLAIPELGLPKAVGLTAVVIASPFLLAIPLVRRRRQALDREIRSLEALMES